ncbi:MAG: MBL fold metallo-hydrolase [Agathobacter sp.]|uniref:MBL fold metallo-hydrolase n=1 Tax=Agathobacter sp. TaxID=2021311 RepID=UPI00258952D2|nr:MBL fold metallo-hydrolase [Agathobacter sp.]MCR5678093.1 MBL fold metallo-hydrolase [Agathobacter sp.]
MADGTNKPVYIQWLSQMGLLIRAGDTKICIDYFASPDDARQIQPPIAVDALTDVDLFLGTHDHLDHIDHEAWKVWAKTNPNAKFIFPRKHLAAVLADGIREQNAIGMNDGECIQVNGIKIHAVAAAHEFLDCDEQGLYPYLQYVLVCDGKRIHHAGDTVRYEQMMPKIKALGPIDFQILPINGRDAVRYRQNCIGNMTYQEAADFAAETGAAMVIPGHWDMFAHNGENPHAFADYLDAKYPGRLICRIPEIMETIEL